MNDVTRAISILAALAGVLAVYAAVTRDNVRLLRAVDRDDWRGVRDTATTLIARDSTWIPRGTRAQARQLVGLAHFVLGDLPTARASLEHALTTNLPPPVEAATNRQLASVERTMGDLDAARARLVSPDATSSDRDRPFVAMQLAQVLIDAREPAAAEAAILPAITAIEARRSGARTSVMRAAFTADLVQARCILVRARIEQGDAVGAGEVWDAGLTGFDDDKRYVHGHLAETGARLALLRGDRTTAADLAEVASGHYAAVGARVDVARIDVLRARIARDRTDLDVAERELRALGALGAVWEVERARQEIEGLG